MFSTPISFLVDIVKKPWFASSLFFSLFLAFYFYQSASFLLQDVDTALPGIASFHQVDVNARIGTFYRVLALFGLSFGILSLALPKLELKSPWLKRLLIRLQPFVWFGIVFLFTEVMQSSQKYVWPIFFAGILGLVVLGLVETLTRRTVDTSKILLGLVLSISITFGTKAFFHLILFTPLAIETEYLFAVLFVVSTLVLSEARPWVLVVITSFPAAVILSSEISWVSASNGNPIAPLISFCVVSVLLTIAFFVLRNRLFKSDSALFASDIFLPLTIISLGLLSHYSPVVEASKELFELANPSNAVMRTVHFGEWPLIDYLNSHLTSELGFRFLFVALNGYSGNTDFLAYDFLHQLIFIWVTYAFLKKVLGNGYWAFFIILAFPWLTIALPISFSIILTSIFLLERCLRSPSLKTYITIGIWSIFLVIWKIDLGVSNLVATVVILLFITLFRNGAVQNMKRLILAALILSSGIGLMFTLIHTFGEVDLVHHLKLAKEYFGAGQAHGFEKLSKKIDQLFVLHHLVFPIATTLVVLIVFIGLARKKLQASFAPLSILFLGIFIIANAQRGLVRHGFMENTDLHLSSFVFLMMGIIVSRLFSRNWLISTFIISICVIPALAKAPSTRGHFSLLTKLQKLKHHNYQNEWENGTRFADKGEFLSKNHGEFKQFMKENFSDDASFIDMSNTPMWYYYTERQVPSYFNQYLQNTVTPFLQKSNLERIKRMNLPVAIFSRWPESWWDRTDRVPNTIRYHFITQHIFENYRPHSIQNERFIWVKNGESIKSFQGFAPDSSSVHRLQDYKLGHFPGVSSKLYGDFTSVENLSLDGQMHVGLNPDFGHNIHQFLQFRARGKKDGAITLQLCKGADRVVGQFTFKLSGKEAKTYTIPVSSQYNWISLKPDHLKFSGIEDAKAEISELEIVALK